MNYEQENNPEEDTDSVIRLSLRKPKEWNWSLDTSLSSSSTIIFPAIQLWDEEEGNLLVDTRRKDLCNATALCIKQNTMQEVNVGKQNSKLPSLKLSSFPANSRLKCQEFETDNNPMRRNTTLSYRSKRDDHFGFGQVSVARSESKAVKIEKDVKTCRTLPLIHRRDLHVQPQSSSKLNICASVGRRNLESTASKYLSHRSSKDVHKPSNSNIQPTSVGRVTLRETSKTHNTNRNVPHAFKRDGCVGSESNVPVSVATRAVKTAKISPEHFEKSFQLKLPASVSKKSLLKKPNSKNIFNIEESGTNLSHTNKRDKQRLSKINVQPTATGKMSSSKELLLANAKKDVESFTFVSSKYGHVEPKTYFKPSGVRKPRLYNNSKIENDLQREDNLSYRNLRKQHKELETNLQLSAARRTSNESKTVKTMGNYNTVPKTKLCLGNFEIKTHEQSIRNIKKKVESNVKPILSLEAIDGKYINTTKKQVLKDKLNDTRITNYSNVNDKSVKYILCKSEQNPSKDLSGIPVKKFFTSTRKFTDDSFNDKGIDFSVDSTLRKSRMDAHFIGKSTENRLDKCRPDKRPVRKINKATKLQQTVDHKTNRIQKSASTSIPLPTTFNTIVHETNKTCTCYQEEGGLFNKRCSTKNKKKVFRKRVPYPEDLSSSSSEPELIILWDHRHLRKPRSENTKGLSIQ